MRGGNPIFQLIRRAAMPALALIVVGTFAGHAIAGPNGVLAWGGYHRALQERPDLAVGRPVQPPGPGEGIGSLATAKIHDHIGREHLEQCLTVLLRYDLPQLLAEGCESRLGAAFIDGRQLWWKCLGGCGCQPKSGETEGEDPHHSIERDDHFVRTHEAKVFAY